MFRTLYKNIFHFLIVILFLGSTVHVVMPEVTTGDFKVGACGSQMDNNAKHHNVPPCCAEKNDNADQPLVQQNFDGHALVTPYAIENFSFTEEQLTHKDNFSHNNSHQKYFVLRV